MAVDTWETGTTVTHWTEILTTGGTISVHADFKKSGNYGCGMTTDGDNDSASMILRNDDLNDATATVWTWIRISDVSKGFSWYELHSAGGEIAKFGLIQGVFKMAYQSTVNMSATPSNNVWYRIEMVYNGTTVIFNVYDTEGSLIETSGAVTPSNTGNATYVRLQTVDVFSSPVITSWDNTTYTSTASLVVQTKTFTADSVLKASGLTKTFTVDGVLVNVNTKDFTADSILQAQGLTKTFTADSILKGTLTKTFTADSLLQSQGLTKDFTVDGLLQETSTKDFTVDSLLQETSTKDFTVDGFLQSQGLTKAFTADSILKSLGLTKTFTADSLLQSQGLTKTFTTDSVLKAVLTKTFTVDVTLINETLGELQTDFATVLADDFFDAAKQLDFAKILEDIPMSEDVTWTRTSQPEDEFGRASASSDTITETISVLIQPITEKDKDILAAGVAITGHMKAYVKHSYDLSGGGSSTPKVGDNFTRSDGQLYEVKTVIGKYSGSNIEIFRKLVLREIDNG